MSLFALRVLLLSFVFWTVSHGRGGGRDAAHPADFAIPQCSSHRWRSTVFWRGTEPGICQPTRQGLSPCAFRHVAGWCWTTSGRLKLKWFEVCLCEFGSHYGLTLFSELMLCLNKLMLSELCLSELLFAPTLCVYRLWATSMTFCMALMASITVMMTPQPAIGGATVTIGNMTVIEDWLLTICDVEKRCHGWFAGELSLMILVMIQLDVILCLHVVVFDTLWF